MRPVKHLPRYTISEYRLWPGDWELIDGIPYAMSPSPVRRHQELAGSLFTQINPSIKMQKKPCGSCRAVYALDWIIDETTVLRPDIAVICNETGDFITRPPVLIIEVISPPTAFKDRQVKFEIYEQQGVKYYLLVDPETRTYNIYKLLNDHYQEATNMASFIIHDACSVQIDVAIALKELDAS